MSMFIGEALAGEGNEIAHIDLLIGDKDGPVGHAFANALAVTADLLAPQLWDRHENDRWIAVKVGHSIANATKVAAAASPPSWRVLAMST